MINLKILFNDFYNILNEKQTLFEILLNLTFVLILLIIAIIFYWDNINRKIINTSRCKIIMNNEDNIFNLDIYDKSENKKIINVSYDNTKKHNVKINCACPVGTTQNKFQVPYYNYEDQKLETDLYKYCQCDAQYESPSNDYSYEGDAFLKDYYTDIYTDIASADNRNKRLIFPS